MTTNVPLSILELATVGVGQTGADALRATLDLAVEADRLGYRRLWFAEHHLSPRLPDDGDELGRQPRRRTRNSGQDVRAGRAHPGGRGHRPASQPGRCSSDRAEARSTRTAEGSRGSARRSGVPSSAQRPVGAKTICSLHRRMMERHRQILEVRMSRGARKHCVFFLEVIGVCYHSGRN